MDLTCFRERSHNITPINTWCWIVFPSCFYTFVSGVFSGFSSWMSNFWVSNFEQHIFDKPKKIRNWDEQSDLDPTKFWNMSATLRRVSWPKTWQKTAFCLCTLLWALLVTCLKRYQFLLFKFYSSRNVGFCLLKKLQKPNGSMIQLLLSKLIEVANVTSKIECFPSLKQKHFSAQFFGVRLFPKPQKIRFGSPELTGDKQSQTVTHQPPGRPGHL